MLGSTIFAEGEGETSMFEYKVVDRLEGGNRTTNDDEGDFSTFRKE